MEGYKIFGWGEIELFSVIRDFAELLESEELEDVLHRVELDIKIQLCFLMQFFMYMIYTKGRSQI